MNNNQENKGTNYDFESARNEMHAQKNPYATSYSQDNRDLRRSGQYSSQMSSRKVKRRKHKFNWGTALFILIIAAIIVFSVIQINKNSDNNTNNGSDIPSPPIEQPNEDTDSPEPPSESSDTDPENIESSEADIDKPEITHPVFTTVVSNSTLDEGDLVLVNYLYIYPEADTVNTVNLYNNRNTPFKVASTDIELTKVAFDAFEKMVDALNNETGCDDMIINSGYRTISDQQDIYDYYLDEKGEEYVKEYVATPGCSEHHTGLACDLSFFLDEGYSEPIGEHEHGSWISDNCSDYGFVIRYPEDKVDITKIAHEAWHFRYVGYPHAKAMTELNYCLEEYVEYLKDFTLDGKLLYISADGKLTETSLSALDETRGWIVYYVKKDDGADTAVTVPGDENTEYSISGNNIDGYYVTVSLG